MSIQDLKSKRCTAITIHGTFEQILDILSQGDLFINNDTNGELEFTNLISDIERTPREKAYLFDDVYNIKGTALMIDLAIEVDESLSNIKECIRKGNPVMVNISENWSMRDELIKEFRKM